MRRGRRQDSLRPAQTAIDVLEALQKTGHGTGTDGNVRPDLHIAPAQLTGNDRDVLIRVQVAHHEERCRQQLTEAPVNLADGLSRDRAPTDATTIDPALDGDMGLGFKLQGAGPCVSAVVILHSPFDIDGMCVVPLDQVGVVTIHRPHEIGECAEQASRQAAAQARRRGRQLDREITQRRPGAQTLPTGASIPSGSGSRRDQ